MRVSRPSFRFLLPAAFILLLAFGVRLVHIQTQSIWFDEGWSAYAAIQPSLVDAANADATNPPLYYALLHVAVRLWGDSELGLRLFSTFAGLLVIALSSLLARRLFDQRAGLYAALLVTVSPLLWWASQEARMYTLLAALVVVAALGWHTIIRRSRYQRIGAWLAVFGAELALLYAHNTGPVVALWLNVVTLLFWLSRRSMTRPDWRLWFAGQVGVALLWVPYFAARFLNLSAANSAVTSAPVLDLALVGATWQAFWVGSWSMVSRVPVLGLLFTDAPYVGLAGLLLVIAALIIPWRRAAARWLVVHVVVLTVGLIIGLVVLGNELHGRYLTMIAPLLLIAIAAGIARGRWLWIRLGLLGLFAFVFAVAIFYAHDPAYQHDDVRGMVRYYADHLSNEDTVLAWSYADRYELAYYWPRLGAQARRVTLPEGADLDHILPLLSTEGDVALNVWYTQRADYRGMLGCLLAHGTARPPEPFATYGMTSLLYRDPALAVPEAQPFPADFGVAQLESVAAIPDFTPDRSLCLPIQLRLSEPVATDLKAAVIVENALGWEVARADAVFAQAAQQTSSQLEPGARLTAYPRIQLPYGAPPGNYRLRLRLYDDQHLSGYEVADETVGRDLEIGTWAAAPGADWTAPGRTTSLPVQTPVEISEDLILLAHDAVPSENPLRNGDPYRLTLLWQGAGPLPDLMLADAQERWAVALPGSDAPHEAMTLDWREAVIPAGAEEGQAELRLPDGTLLATYTIQSVPAIFEAPEVETLIGSEIPGVGMLVGLTTPSEITLGELLPATLVWKAGETPIDRSLTVFVQLLDANGQLIAQSDSVPAQGQRPTSGWRPDEYVIDDHRLAFNDRARSGPATLIAGLYDAETGERVRFADGSNSIELRMVNVEE